MSTKKPKKKIKLTPLPLNNDAAELVLSLDRKRIDNIVTVQTDPKTQKEIRRRWYMLESDGNERDGYMNFTQTRMAKDSDGETTVKNFAGLQAQLIQSVLYSEADSSKPTLEEIQSWPSSTQKTLHDWAQQLCALVNNEDEDEDAGKN